MVVGPEVAALIDFENAHQLIGKRDEVPHRDQTASVPKAFRTDVSSPINVMEKLGNPLKEMCNL